MGRRYATGALLTGALALGASVAAGAPRVDGRMEAGILRAINVARRADGLASLRPSPLLRAPARAHSRWLVGRTTLTHEGPGRTPFWTRLQRAGFPRTRPVAENLAMVVGCGVTPARMVSLWLGSPPHRRNLLSAAYRVFGVGVATQGGCGRTVLTTDFGG